MRLTERILSTPFCLTALLLLACLSLTAASAQQAGQAHDPLTQMLLQKGILTPDEARLVEQAATPQQAEAKLAQILLEKGVISKSDFDAIASKVPQPPAVPLPVVAASAEAPTQAPKPVLPPVSEQSQHLASIQSPQRSPNPTAPAGPSVVAAIAPLRVLPFDPPKAGGLTGLKIGQVTFTPYGFIKGTAEYDTSSPNGDDFPIPAGLMLLPGSNTGPNADPEFHMKARQSRIGVNLEWPTLSKKLVLTGRMEADFEGNFNESDNADVTSIRNPNLRLRLAYVRLDYRHSDATSLFFVGGQDWTLFGSKALSNVLDTTWNDADYGAIYNRSPQFRFGLVQKLSSSPWNLKLSPEFAMMMPSSGQVEKLSFCTLAAVYCNGASPTSGILSQIGEAERQGADSNKPELAAALTLQFQLDKAPGVAPAQVFWAGFEGRRTSIVANTAVDLLGASYPAAAVAGTSFAKGFTASSDMYGNQLALQLPTRWATLVVSGYRGADLRQVLGGQLSTNYTNAIGLTPMFYGTGTDNVAGTLSGFAMLGCTGAFSYTDGTGNSSAKCSGKVKVAPQHGVGAYGGFVELGLPLSRWFNASPSGLNAGWQLYLHAGKDQLVHRDAAMQLGLADGVGPNQGGQGLGIPMIGSQFLGATLNYKLNSWCTFSFEQSHYSSRAIPELGKFWVIAGVPSRIWQDQRAEFGPVFNF